MQGSQQLDTDGSGNYVGAALAAVNAVVPGTHPDLARLYALLVLTTGVDTTEAQVYDAWAIHAAEHSPGHTCLKPREDLPLDVQELDRPFAEAIRAAALSLRPPNPGRARS
jgi:hypothetical protein